MEGRNHIIQQFGALFLLECLQLDEVRPYNLLDLLLFISKLNKSVTDKHWSLWENTYTFIHDKETMVHRITNTRGFLCFVLVRLCYQFLNRRAIYRVWRNYVPVSVAPPFQYTLYRLVSLLHPDKCDHFMIEINCLINAVSSLYCAWGTL